VSLIIFCICVEQSEAVSGSGVSSYVPSDLSSIVSEFNNVLNLILISLRGVETPGSVDKEAEAPIRKVVFQQLQVDI
jgi:hypothetical protein